MEKRNHRWIESGSFESIHDGWAAPAGTEVAPRGNATSCRTLKSGRCQAAVRRYSGAERGRRWRMAPRASQMPRAIHSASEKCPGNAGRTFIRKSSKETAIPSPLTIRIDGRFSTIQNDRHAANHPMADAIEPRSEEHT